MASFLATKSAAGIRRLSSLLIRNLSTDAANPNFATSPAAAIQKPKRKKKNLLEVAQFLPNWGIGYHMAKTHWETISYQITKINLYKDGRHGKAWGIAHKDGLPIVDVPKKISGVHKRCWKYIPNSKKIQESTPQPEALADAIFPNFLLFN